MFQKSSRGFAHILIFITSLLIVLTVSFFATRQQIYAFYQETAYKLGVNLNDISSSKFVENIKSQNGKFELAGKALFLNNEVKQAEKLADFGVGVLGYDDGQYGEKWIEVDLSEQRLYMKEGQTTVGSFLVSTGKYAPTPTGEWRIWIKLRYTRMEGGSKALGTYYNLPNVPYVMYFYQGYGIHGAYWHNDFGRPRSHGCINMRPEEAGIVFNWASPQLPAGNGVVYPSSSNPGTRVVIHQ